MRLWQGTYARAVLLALLTVFALPGAALAAERAERTTTRQRVIVGIAAVLAAGSASRTSSARKSARAYVPCQSRMGERYPSS